MVPDIELAVGVEPTTCRLQGGCSNQLSYASERGHGPPATGFGLEKDTANPELRPSSSPPAWPVARGWKLVRASLAPSSPRSWRLPPRLTH